MMDLDTVVFTFQDKHTTFNKCLLGTLLVLSRVEEAVKI
jgi:hypothetical protein